VKRDVETAEMSEDPPAQLTQHLLPDATRPAQEEHSAGGLHHHHTAQCCDDEHQRVGRSTREQRRDPAVDALLHQQRNRQPRNVLHDHDDGEHRDGPAVRAQQ
jgi:hypothetical protein